MPYRFTRKVSYTVRYADRRSLCLVQRTAAVNCILTMHGSYKALLVLFKRIPFLSKRSGRVQNKVQTYTLAIEIISSLFATQQPRDLA